VTADWARGEERYRPDDDCPLFSERLEEHIVGLTRGELPNRGRFCGNCYTPMSVETLRCPHCHVSVQERPPVGAIPDAVVTMLRRQRKTEQAWVNGFAYLGLVLAAVFGLGIVLGVPYLRANLLPATIVYGLLLVVGSRMLAGLLGGYWGDRMGYERGRRELRASWEQLVAERDRATSRG
jgi:hypothetical protein